MHERSDPLSRDPPWFSRLGPTLLTGAGPKPLSRRMGRRGRLTSARLPPARRGAVVRTVPVRGRPCVEASPAPPITGWALRDRLSLANVTGVHDGSLGEEGCAPRDIVVAKPTRMG